MLRVLDLFSGIGGFSLGLERTGGFKTVAFCEIEPFCRRVLAKHWPDVPIHEDVTKLRGSDVGEVEVICGGFPCQDLSKANAPWSDRPGLAGARSGLWSEFSRLIGELRPNYVILENVTDLLRRALGDILGDLAAIGYDAEWYCISARDVGAPHLRSRIWIVAHPHRERLAGEHGEGQPSRNAGRSGEAFPWLNITGAPAADWVSEPTVGRMGHGFPSRVDRLRGLGNAVVPQIVEAIGRAILAAEHRP